MQNAEAENKRPTSQNQPDEATQEQQNDVDDRTVDPRDLVYKGGYQGNPRDIVENPAVAPQMPDGQVTEARAGLMQKDRNPDAEDY